MKKKETMVKVSNYMSDWCREHKEISVMVLYGIVYLVTFFYLEARKTSYHVIHFGIDAYIPFCEYFIVPYLLWFVYVAGMVLYLGLKDKEECRKMVAFLIAGMTIFLVISAVFPNGHHLRPKTFTRDNIFVDLVKHLYTVDTSTNVVPSIHVYNSIAVMIAVWRTKCFQKKYVRKWMLLLLGVSIICSTVLLKQHSMLDVLVACILSALVYAVCYRNERETGTVAQLRMKKG